AVEVGAHGLGVERRVVVERHALLEVERVRQAVLADVPALGEQRRRVGGAGLDAHEALEDLARDPERLAVAGERGVERAGLCRAGEDERAVAAPAGAAFGVPLARDTTAQSPCPRT